MDPEFYKHPYFWLAVAVGIALGMPAGVFFALHMAG